MGSTHQHIHSPAPSPGRAIYGFVLYLITYVAFALYLLWAFLPDSWITHIGITYRPQRYWVIAAPVYLCVAVLYAFIMNIAYSFMITPTFDSINIMTDNFQKTLICDHRPCGIEADAIPPLADIHPDYVSRCLYKDKR